MMSDFVESEVIKKAFDLLTNDWGHYVNCGNGELYLVDPLLCDMCGDPIATEEVTLKSEELPDWFSVETAKLAGLEEAFEREGRQIGYNFFCDECMKQKNL